VIADPHACEPFMSLDRMKRIVDTANALEPDVALLMGDYAATHRFITRRIDYQESAAVFRDLAAKLGRYAIIGNHDWWDDRAAQQRRAGPTLARLALEGQGIPVFENDGIRLEKSGQPFWLLGLGDLVAFRRGHGEFSGIDDLPGTLAKVSDDAPVLLMTHEPDIFPQVPSRVSLTLAGHTHGGQVRLFGWSPIVPSMYGNRYAYGHVVEDQRHLIVSGGLGCSGFPLRVGSVPELVVVDLGGDATV
jgi:predicted MPP superfamily phosphohydrolase